MPRLKSISTPRFDRIISIIRFREREKRWPSTADFEGSNPALPPYSTLHRLFGGLRQALVHAQRLYWVKHPDQAREVHGLLELAATRRRLRADNAGPLNVEDTERIDAVIDRKFGRVDRDWRVMPPREVPPDRREALLRAIAQRLPS